MHVVRSMSVEPATRLSFTPRARPSLDGSAERPIVGYCPGTQRRIRGHPAASRGTVVVVTGGVDPDPAVASGDGERAGISTDDLLVLVGKGDRDAFETLYDRVAGLVFGTVLRVVRDPAQSEEVAQEVLVELWRTAERFDPDRAGAITWVVTMAHRRAVDRVRSAQASADRDQRAARLDAQTPYDVVSEEVQVRLDREQVRDALGELTEIQRTTVELAYYGGYSQTEVARILDIPLGTVKTRMRDGLIRLRQAMGVTA
jgi:RNA polymerase sigma-70 factor, ECF subfamily